MEAAKTYRSVESALHSTEESTIVNLELKPFFVYIVTWNVGTRYPDNISLSNLLQLHVDKHIDGEHARRMPDMYVIGLQEVKTQPQNQMLNLLTEESWVTKAKDALKSFDYIFVKSRQMQGLLVILFVKRQHLIHVSEIETEYTRTGFGGLWGNKGAVSIRLNIYGCHLTFVCAHLAAHDQHLDERIEDFNQIVENHHYHVKNCREIFDHDYVFWFGDLNFRIHGDDEPEEMREALEHDDKMAAILQRDQLTHVRQRTKEAFHLMEERLPAFPPTFKYKEGTSTYDMKRRPAWTDRILYAVQPLNKQPLIPLSINQLSYKSHPEYNISDHKPVSSEFKLSVFKNYRVVTVEFEIVENWYIGECNTIEYKKPADFEEKENDYIAIYPADFHSVGEYIAYEYLYNLETPPTPEEVEQQAPLYDQPHQQQKRLKREQHGEYETVRVEFGEDVRMKEGEEYILLYYKYKGNRPYITSIAAMSNKFRAKKR